MLNLQRQGQKYYMVATIAVIAVAVESAVVARVVTAVVAVVTFAMQLQWL